jgi:hypothetical protein
MSNYISDYSFNNITRIGSDCLDNNTIQNTDAMNYTLKNFFSSDGDQSIVLATSQPCVNYKGCKNISENIDVSSNLLIGSVQCHPRCHISLFQRPFSTVPYLGRGSVCAVLESQIQQGDYVTNRKSISQLTEKSYIKYSNTPLLPQLRGTITNPDNCVEESANSNFIRGGLPSRELTRDRDYYTTHTQYQYTG